MFAQALRELGHTPRRQANWGSTWQGENQARPVQHSEANDDVKNGSEDGKGARKWARKKQCVRAMSDDANGWPGGTMAPKYRDAVSTLPKSPYGLELVPAKGRQRT